MSIRLEILDGTTPMLEKIMLISHGMALETLSVAGAHLQREARLAMVRKRHQWANEIEGGKRRIYKMQNANRELGLRMAREGGLANPKSMSNFITSYLNEKSMVVVVGGRHKSFTPNKRRDGEVVGTMPRVAAVSKASHAILHKLNFGELNENYTRKSMRRFRGAQYTGYRFMEEGYAAAKGQIEDAMTRRYETLLHKAVNRAKVKTIKKVYA